MKVQFYVQSPNIDKIDMESQNQTTNGNVRSYCPRETGPAPHKHRHESYGNWNRLSDGAAGSGENCNNKQGSISKLDPLIALTGRRGREISKPLSEGKGERPTKVRQRNMTSIPFAKFVRKSEADLFNCGLLLRLAVLVLYVRPIILDLR